MDSGAILAKVDLLARLRRCKGKVTPRNACGKVTPRNACWVWVLQRKQCFIKAKDSSAVRSQGRVRKEQSRKGKAVNRIDVWRRCLESLSSGTVLRSKAVISQSIVLFSFVRARQSIYRSCRGKALLRVGAVMSGMKKISLALQLKTQFLLLPTLNTTKD